MMLFSIFKSVKLFFVKTKPNRMDARPSGTHVADQRTSTEVPKVGAGPGVRNNFLFLGTLDITFKYLLEIISPIVR